MDENARIINGGKYNGMDRYEARKAIAADLEEQRYLVKVEAHSHSVGIRYRCSRRWSPLPPSMVCENEAPGKGGNPVWVTCT